MGDSGTAGEHAESPDTATDAEASDELEQDKPAPAGPGTQREDASPDVKYQG